jgi:hypothetical protein
METYNLDIIPEKECKNRGVYIMDPHVKFNSMVGIYNKEDRCFVGLNSKDIIIISNHIDTDSGYARPVIQIPITCTVDSLHPYTVYEDNLEVTNTLDSGRVTLANWDLHVFLAEYENAYAQGAFV